MKNLLFGGVATLLLCSCAFAQTVGQSTAPGGSNTQLQYNASGSLGGISGATTNGTFVTLATPTFTGQEIHALGSAMAPTISPFGDQTSGLFWTSATNLSVGVSGNERFRFGSGGSFADIGGLAVGSTVSGADTFLTRNAAAVWQLGAANAAAPIAQTLMTQGSRGGTDTNTAGANLTISSGQGTGNSTPSSLIFQIPVAVASGTGAQTITQAASVSSPAGLTVAASFPITLGKSTDPGTAPGAGFCAIFVVAGTTGGSGKLIIRCGTSTTPVTIVDNVGSGF